MISTEDGIRIDERKVQLQNAPEPIRTTCESESKIKLETKAFPVKQPSSIRLAQLGTRTSDAVPMNTSNDVPSKSTK
jgi:hypothetical protein